MALNLKKLLNLNNLLKVIGLVDAVKDLKGKPKGEQVEGGTEIAIAVLGGLEGVEVSKIEVLIRDIEVWAKEGERIAREGERVLKSVREAVARVGR